MVKSRQPKNKFLNVKFIVLVLIAVTIPLTTWIIVNVSTKTNSHASSVSGISCFTAPKWNLVGHIDYATSVKFSLTLTSTCPNASVDPYGLFNDFTTWAKVPVGWTYKFNVSGCSLNQTCRFTVDNTNKTSISVTISRPSNAKLGTYIIPIYAKNFDSPAGIKNLSYIVTK